MDRLQISMTICVREKGWLYIETNTLEYTKKINKKKTNQYKNKKQNQLTNEKKNQYHSETKILFLMNDSKRISYTRRITQMRSSIMHA